MPDRSPRLLPAALALALALSLVASSASAGGRTRPPARSAPRAAGLGDWLLGFLSLWLPAGGFLEAKEGCTIDPNGLCRSWTITQSGCTIDPGGSCGKTGPLVTGSSGENGCTIDPNGSCAPGH